MVSDSSKIWEGLNVDNTINEKNDNINRKYNLNIFNIWKKYLYSLTIRSDEETRNVNKIYNHSAISSNKLSELVFVWRTA